VGGGTEGVDEGHVMSAEIVKFPVLRIPPNTSGPRESQEKLRQYRQGLVRDVRAAADDPKRKFARNEEIAPAQTVNRLLSEAKAKGITIEKHVRPELEKRKLSIRHLDRLRVNHEISPLEAKKTVSKDLVRKIRPYVQIIDVLADLLERNRDEVISDAFRETEFFRSGPVSIDAVESNLSWILHAMTDWIVRSEKLREYFKEGRRIHGRYDPVLDKFLYGGVGTEDEEAYENNVDWALTQHIMPTVPLVRLHRATFSGPLEVEKAPIAQKDAARALVAEMCDIRRIDLEGVPPLGKTKIVDTEIILSTDIRLVVGPRTRNDDLGPMFEICSHVALQTDGVNRALTFDLSSFPLSARTEPQFGDLDEHTGSVAAQFEEGWHRVRAFGTKGWRLQSGSYRTNDSPDGIDPASDAGPSDRDPKYFGTRLDGGIIFDPVMGQSCSEWAVYWHPINPLTIGKLVELLSRSEVTWLLDVNGPKEKPALFQFAGPECQQFETALYTLAVQEALVSECRHLKTKLAECIVSVQSELEAQMRSLVTRWQE
jgi:hypothetical protein